MLETPHVAVGIAIATKFPNPYIAIPLSFLSHFALDRVPHWNPHLFTETQKTGKPSKSSTAIGAVDITLSLAMGTFFAIQAPDIYSAALILVCCLSSVASDVIKYPYYYFKARQKWLVKWVNLERSMQVDTQGIIPGMLTQIVTILAAFYWIYS